MDELEELRRQLRESVEDEDFISPDKAKDMLGLIESVFRQYEFGSREEEFLHHSEDIAYEACALCDASAEYAPPVLFGLLKELNNDDVTSLRKAICAFSNAVDQIKFLAGPSLAPDVFMLLPGVNGTVYWIKLRQVSRMLEVDDA